MNRIVIMYILMMLLEVGVRTGIGRGEGLEPTFGYLGTDTYYPHPTVLSYARNRIV